MKSKLYLWAMCASLIYGSSAYAEMTCPSIPENWDGKTDLNGWHLDPNYQEKLDKKRAKDQSDGYKPYSFYNAWIYSPDTRNEATCHYTYEGAQHNQLSLEMPGKNTSNTHFKVGNVHSEGVHCTQGTAEECAFLEGPATENH